MNGWIILSIVASIAVVLMCVAILLGRGDWLVYELRSEERQKYHIMRLRVVTSISYLLLPPSVVGASIEMFKMLSESDALHDKLQGNVNYFRDKMLAAGFDIKPTQSAICAVMLYDAKLSQVFAAKMAEEGIFVTGFYYPVVPKGQARIRVQLSAAHEPEHLDRAIAAFIKVGKELGVIK